jgi:four helix bundle protein
MNQRLNCYNLLVDVAKAMPDLIHHLPRGESYLVDQLKRALASSILNLAEGNGRYSVKERNRFFDFSLGSIKEVMAVFDIIVSYRYIQYDYINPLLNNLTKSFNMIRKLKK